MKLYMLDSNSLNSVVFESGSVYELATAERKAGSFLGTSTPIAAEFLGGQLAGDHPNVNAPIVKRAIAKLRLWPFDFASANEYARLYAELKRRGVRMQAIDLMSAAIARLLPDCTVVTCDSDFSHVPGLTVENWMD